MNHMIVVALEIPDYNLIERTARLAGRLERLIAEQMPEVTKHCVIFQEDGRVTMFQDGLSGQDLPQSRFRPTTNSPTGADHG